MINNCSSSKKYLNCSCHSKNHLIVVEFDKESFLEDGFEDCFYIHVQLSPYQKFLNRLLIGIKYILNINSNDKHWDVSILDRKQVQKLHDLTTSYLETTDVKCKDLYEDETYFKDI